MRVPAFIVPLALVVFVGAQSTNDEAEAEADWAAGILDDTADIWEVLPKVTEAWESAASSDDAGGRRAVVDGARAFVLSRAVPLVRLLPAGAYSVPLPANHEHMMTLFGQLARPLHAHNEAQTPCLSRAELAAVAQAALDLICYRSSRGPTGGAGGVGGGPAPKVRLNGIDNVFGSEVRFPPAAWRVTFNSSAVRLLGQGGLEPLYAPRELKLEDEDEDEDLQPSTAELWKSAELRIVVDDDGTTIFPPLLLSEALAALGVAEAEAVLGEAAVPLHTADEYWDIILEHARLALAARVAAAQAAASDQEAACAFPLGNELDLTLTLGGAAVVRSYGGSDEGPGVVAWPNVTLTLGEVPLLVFEELVVDLGKLCNLVMPIGLEFLVPLSLKLSTDLGDAFESLGSLFNFDGIRTSWVALSIFTGLGATGVGLLRVPLSTGFRIVGVVANGWGLLLSCVFIPLTAWAVTGMGGAALGVLKASLQASEEPETAAVELSGSF